MFKRSDAYYKAVNKGVKKIYKQYLLKVRRDDSQVINKLEAQKSKNAYLLGLIRADIEKGKK